MAYSDNFPAQRPVFQADFANGGKIDPRATFSRASTGTFFGTEKVLSSENLLLQSNSFATTWGHSGLVERTGGQTDPSGGTTAFVLRENSAGGYHRIYQSIDASGDLAFTVYAKQNAGTRYLLLTLLDTDNDWEAAIYDLAGGTPTSVSGTSSGFTGVSATQTASGNGFYKCVLKATGSASSNAYISLSNSTSSFTSTYGLVSYTADGVSSINIAFASLSSVGSTEYVPTTTQIARSYQTKLQTAASGAARFEHSASDGQSIAKGILIEGQSANVMAYSRNGFDASNSFQYTLHSGVTATENAAVGPSGSLDATLLSEDSTTGAHQLQTTETVTSAAHTVSVYVKPLGAPSFGIRISSGVVYGSVFTFADESFTNYGTAPEASRIESVGGGWYRLSISQTVTSGSSLIRFNLFDSGGNATYAGTGYNGILLWGFQCEANSFPSSWVDTGTSGSTATRASDNLSVATADIGYTGGDFTVIAEANMPGDNVGNVVEVGDGTSSNRATLQARTDGSQGVTVSNAGSVQAYIGNTSARNAKRAMRVATNNFGYCESGETVATDTAGVVPVTSTLYVGKGYSGSELNGTLKRVALYNEALSDTNLQALTS